MFVPNPPLTRTTTTEPIIRCKTAAWAALRERTGLVTDTALAAALGVSIATVGRVMAGRQAPTNTFMAHALHAFPFASWERLFTLDAEASR